VADVLVVNASPLIFLGNAGHLELLRVMEPARVVVPEAVFDEVTRSGHADMAARAALDASWIERAVPQEVPSAVVEWDLGPGESAVIALALQLGTARPVIDDLQGRKCALALGLRVTGTLGVVIAAHRRGLVPDLRASILGLREAGMWLSDAVVDRVLAVAGVAR